MKSFIKYISLLIFSGLILPFYNSVNYKIPLGKACSKFQKVQTEPTKMADKVKSADFSFIKDIAGELFPVLKNLN